MTSERRNELDNLAKSHVNFAASFTPDIVRLARRLQCEVSSLDTSVYDVAAIFDGKDRRIGVAMRHCIENARWLVAVSVASSLLSLNEPIALCAQFDDTFTWDDAAYLARHLLIDYSYIEGYARKYKNCSVPAFEVLKLSETFKVPLCAIIDTINDIRNKDRT